MRRLIAVVIAVGLVGAGSLSTAGPADATKPGANGRIVFWSSRDEIEGELYVWDLTSSPWQRLTYNAGHDWDPQWSPDGTEIAYSSGSMATYDIWVTPVGGGLSRNLTNLGGEDGEPSWSPDGELIAYSSNIAGQYDVWTMTPYGLSNVNLTPGASEEFGPVWSPDGTEMAFSSDRAGLLDVFVMDADGTNVVNLTGSATSRDDAPTWSPDGSQIAFLSDRSGSYGLYVMDVDGSNQRLLTLHAGQNTDPEWSPDGTRIMFTSFFDGDGDLWAIDPDGSNLSHVTNDPGMEWWGAWESLNRLPDVVDDSYQTPFETALTVPAPGVLGNDSDPDGDTLTVYDPAGAAAANGTVSMAADGSFTYTPDPGFSGNDTFAYGGDDGNGSLIGLARVTIAVAAAGVPTFGDTTVGLVSSLTGEWFLRDGAGVVSSFLFGDPGDYPFVGDWDCDGIDTPGLFRTSDAYAYLRNSNTQGVADIRFFFGNPSDVPLAGDFNGDGCDTLSIYRPSEQRFYIINKLGENEGGLGEADYWFLFGNPGDKPVVGDWDGDGVDEVGLHRESSGYFYYRNTLTTGVADGEFYFGDPGDRFVAGDWGIVDGRDTPAVFRPSNTVFYFRHTLTQGVADAQFTWTGAGTSWLPVAGDFDL